MFWLLNEDYSRFDIRLIVVFVAEFLIFLVDFVDLVDLVDLVVWRPHAHKDAFICGF